MPAYRALFNGSPDLPRQDARDLVAYLETLGRARELAGPEGEARARAACNCEDDAMAAMAFHAPAVNASPARTRRDAGDRPTLAPSTDRGLGLGLFAANCAGCHGPRGLGDGPGAAGLHPRPTNLAEHDYTRARLADVLWNGVAGTAMQAWRDHGVDDLSALADAVRGLAASREDVPASPDVLDRGRAVYLVNCAQCHGDTGAGDGWSAARIRIAPTNFGTQRATLDATLRAIRDGIDGTPMAPWPARLGDAEIQAVAAYTRSLFAPDAAPDTGGRP